jgi:hypothetical protein
MGRIRSFLSMMFSRSAWGFWHVGRGAMNWRREVGEPMESSAVAAPSSGSPGTSRRRRRRCGHSTTARRSRSYAHPILRLLQRRTTTTPGRSSGWRRRRLERQRRRLLDRDPGPRRVAGELWWAPSWMIRPYGTDERLRRPLRVHGRRRETPLDPSLRRPLPLRPRPGQPALRLSPLKSCCARCSPTTRPPTSPRRCSGTWASRPARQPGGGARSRPGGREGDEGRRLLRRSFTATGAASRS